MAAQAYNMSYLTMIQTALKRWQDYQVLLHQTKAHLEEKWGNLRGIWIDK
jgi:hypothetical protein